MRLEITNNRKAPYGVECISRRYVFLKQGQTATIDAANPKRLFTLEFLDVRALDDESGPMPISLAAKVARQFEPEPAPTYVGARGASIPVAPAMPPKKHEPDPEPELLGPSVPPAAAPEPAAEKKSGTSVLDELRALAEEAGIKVDRRWGEKRLREKIKAYQKAQR